MPAIPTPDRVWRSRTHLSVSRADSECGLTERRQFPGLDLPADEFLAEFRGPVLCGAGHEHLAAGAAGLVQQGQQAGAAAGVEFTHDVVDQQDGRGAVDAGEVFRLRHLQGEGEGSFLPFAGECGRRLAVHDQGEVVAVRAENGGLQHAFAGPALGERDGEVAGDTRLVFEQEFVGIGGNPAEGEPHQRGEFRGERAAGGHELVAEFHELAGEGGELFRVGLRLLEQGVAVA